MVPLEMPLCRPRKKPNLQYRQVSIKHKTQREQTEGLKAIPTNLASIQTSDK